MIYSFESRRKINEVINKFKPDIAHIHNIYGRITPSVLSVLNRNNIPVVMTLHDYKVICPAYTMVSNGKPCERCKDGKYYQVILRKCVKNSYLASVVYGLESYIYYIMKTYRRCVDYYLAPSQFIRKKMIEFGFPKNRIIYLPNFIDNNKYYSINNQGNYFCYIGKLIDVKGLLTLLKAMKEIKESMLYIVGDGENKHKLINYIKINNIKNIRLLGHLKNEEVYKILSDAKFVILPSECYENAPLAILEAFAHSKAVIASNIGGIPEMVKDGETGLLFEAGNYKQLGEKIKALLLDKEKAIKMGIKGKLMVEKEFSPELHYTRLISVYERAIKDHIMKYY